MEARTTSRLAGVIIGLIIGIILTFAWFDSQLSKVARAEKAKEQTFKAVIEDTRRQFFADGYRLGVRQTVLHVKLVHDEPKEEWIAGMIAAANLPLEEWRKKMRELEPLGAWGEAPELEKVQPTPSPAPSPTPTPAPVPPSVQVEPGAP